MYLFVCIKVCLDETQVKIWSLIQVHVLSGQRFEGGDAFGHCFWLEEAILQEKNAKND